MAVPPARPQGCRRRPGSGFPGSMGLASRRLRLRRAPPAEEARAILAMSRPGGLSKIYRELLGEGVCTVACNELERLQREKSRVGIALEGMVNGS